MLAAELPPLLARLAAFVFGALWGSFFNVAIYRWPRDMSVVEPPSHCPACGTRIPAYRNVPIFGWLVLRGRAACCGAPIPARYFLVELLSAVLCVAIVEHFLVQAAPETRLLAAAIESLLYFAFVGGLLIATFVDLEWMEIPDEVSFPGTALGLLTVTLRSDPGAQAAAIGAGAGYLVVQGVFVWAYERLTGRRGMGEGDAGLLMMIGAFLGWQGALFALVAGAFQGLLAAIIALLAGKKIEPTSRREEEETEAEGETAEGADQVASENIGQLKVPFGPFLALGALEFLFFGEWILAAYGGLFGEV